MKKCYLKIVSGTALAVMFLFASCHSAYEVTKAEGRMQPIDSTYDVAPDAEAIALLAPYKAKIDSMMYRVVGTAEMSWIKELPKASFPIWWPMCARSGCAGAWKTCRYGLVNMGGLRNVLTEGPITCSNIYEILPFENSLCVVTLKGVYLKQLFESIAARGGEGVSGVNLRITKSGKLLGATVAGKPVVDDKLYTVATIDYLADGNSDMTALIQAEKRDCPPGATLRGLFMDYVEQQTAAGKKITSRMEGRITVED